jgi:hypothetical protein
MRKGPTTLEFKLTYEKLAWPTYRNKEKLEVGD